MNKAKDEILIDYFKKLEERYQEELELIGKLLLNEI